MASGITLIVLSIIAISSGFFIKNIESKTFIKRLAIYQGCLGALACYWGAYHLIIEGIFGISGTLLWVDITVYLMHTVLGMLLCYGMIAQYVFSDSGETERGYEMLLSVAPWQTRLGVVSLVVSILSILNSAHFMTSITTIGYGFGSSLNIVILRFHLL